MNQRTDKPMDQPMDQLTDQPTDQPMDQPTDQLMDAQFQIPSCLLWLHKKWQNLINWDH